MDSSEVVKAFDLGRKACREGKDYTDNPYDAIFQASLFDAWDNGFQTEVDSKFERV